MNHKEFLTLKELLTLKDSLTHSLTCLEESGQPEAEYVWTSLITANFNKTLQGHWQQHTIKEKFVPPIKVLLEFLEDRILCTPEGTIPSCSSELRQESHRKPKAVIHSTQPTFGFWPKCTLCTGERHFLYNLS